MFNTSLFNERLINAASSTLASISFVGDSTLVIEPVKLKGGIIRLTGDSSLFVSGRYKANGVISLQGEGVAVLNGGKLQKAAVTMLGDSVLDIQPTRVKRNGASFNGEGVLAIEGSRVLISGIEYMGDSIFSGRGVAAAYFISSDGLLRPLGVRVLGDSRKSLMPTLREYSEIIPGKHGEVLLDTKLGSRIIELHVATDDGLSLTEREQLKRTIARYLNPTAGEKALIFADDLDKTYSVKYSGSIPLEQYPNWFDFTIPFKMNNPYIQETFEQSLAGSGIITNSGDVETSLIIEITGPVTNPSITVGNHILTYNGTIGNGKVLTINTGRKTVEIDGVNVVDEYNGVFPKIPPGNTDVTAGDNVIFRWRGRWVFC